MSTSLCVRSSSDLIPLSSVMLGLIVIGGTLLLIIPGIIWAVKFQFYGYFIVDEQAGPVEALIKSSMITEGAKWDLFIFGFCIGVINMLGALMLIVGLFATIPTTMVALAYVYRRLVAGQFQVSPEAQKV